MKKLFLPAAVLAVGTALVAAPMAASAATLPDDQSLYGYQAGFYSVDSTNAAVSLIGSATAYPGGTYGMDYSDKDGVAYFFVNGAPCEFYSLDITTGVATDIGPIVDGVVDSFSCDAMDIVPDGTVYVGAEDTIYEIDTATGAASAAHLLGGDPLNGSLGWLATDPTTGIMYVGDYASGDFFSVDKTTWDLTFVGTAGTPYIESGDFDSNGVFWFSGDGPSRQGLQSLELSDLSTITTYGDFLNSSDVSVSVYAVFVQGGAKPAATLPSTGSDASGLLPLGIGAGILLLVGAGAILVARRRATS